MPDIMDNVTRIGVSLEPELLDQFDKMIERKGYVTRSEAFRDLIRDALTQTFVENEEARVCGTITLIYNHHKGDVKEKLTDIQHEHHDLISSSIHVHLDLERCLEVLVVCGKARDIKDLADHLGSVRGVQNGVPVMLSSEITEHEHPHDAASDHHH
ncbi:MAG: putative nickel-responsive regulator [Methanomassiliicoccales archaeon PtaU1.Bin124]|nr:MAG: putative nickel-responsive regulator [Methanomassiliicoccales archaeon PtaU1.Bin124]